MAFILAIDDELRVEDVELSRRAANVEVDLEEASDGIFDFCKNIKNAYRTITTSAVVGSRRA